jgi:hypothetical protein
MRIDIKPNKTLAAKLANNGLVAASRIAESWSNDIDSIPPLKSSAERRLRTTSENARDDDAGTGSFDLPRPTPHAFSRCHTTQSGAKLGSNMHSVNQWIIDRLV